MLFTIDSVTSKESPTTSEKTIFTVKNLEFKDSHKLKHSVCFISLNSSKYLNSFVQKQNSYSLFIEKI